MTTMKLSSLAAWALFSTFLLRHTAQAKTRGVIYDKERTRGLEITHPCKSRGKKSAKKGDVHRFLDHHHAQPKKEKSSEELHKKVSKPKSTKAPGVSGKKGGSGKKEEIYCEEYCDMLDDYPFPNATYMVGLTLSIVDTPFATEQALNDLFNEEIADDLQVCVNDTHVEDEDLRFLTTRTSRRLMEGTILTIEFDSNYVDEPRCEFEDTSIKGECAQFNVYGDVTYDLGDPDQFSEEIYQAVVAQCGAIQELPEVESAYDPCPYITITYVGSELDGDADGEIDSDSGGSDGEEPHGTTDTTDSGPDAGSNGADDGQDIQIVDDGSGSDSGTGDDTGGGSGTGDDTGGGSGTGDDAGDETEGNSLARNSNNNNNKENEDNEEKGAPAIADIVGIGDGSQERRLALGLGLAGLLFGLGLCLFLIIGCRRKKKEEDPMQHKELIDEDEEEPDMNADAASSGSGLDETTLDSSSPGRPGIRSGNEAELVGFDEDEAPSSVHNPVPPVLFAEGISSSSSSHDVHKCTSATCTQCNPGLASAVGRRNTEFVAVSPPTPPESPPTIPKNQTRTTTVEDVVSL